MGLFGSNKKTLVGTSVSRVIEDDQIPDSVLEGMTRNLVETGDQMTEQVMESLSNSIALRANRMYNFGRNGYLYGVPTGTVHSSFAGKQASQAALQTLTGGTVQIEYYHFGPLNLLHLAWQRLMSQFGYDPATNKIDSLSTTQKPVYLRNLRIVVNEASLEELSNGSLDQWGVPPTAGPTPENGFRPSTVGVLGTSLAYVVDPNTTQDYALVDTCWTEQEPVMPGSSLMKTVIKFGSFNMSLAGMDMTKDFHQARYLDHNNRVGYWIYQTNAGTYPEIDAVFNTAYDGSGHIFPWLYFRFNRVSQGLNKLDRPYKDSRRMANILNLDFDRLVEGIHNNPDIADVEQAMMMMAVPANTSNGIERRYLFDFFSGLYASQKAQDHANAAADLAAQCILQSLSIAVNRSSMIIQDARFKMALNWKNIVKRKVAGSIGPVGTYLSGANSVPASVNIPSLSGDIVSKDVSEKRHWYQHQVSTGVYEEIQIFELKMTYFVFGEYTTTGDETDEILLIPVDMSIARAYTIPEREVLYSRSLHYVFNSKVVVKLKWYQTGIFKVVLTIVMVILALFTYGASLKALFVALAAGTLTIGALAMILLEMLLRYLVTNLLMRLFVKLTNAKVAFLVALVAAIAGTAIGYEAGIQGSLTASQLLNLSTGLAREINQRLRSDAIHLQEEYSEFRDYVKEQTQLLEKTQDLLDSHVRLAPIVVFGEKPDDFYQRTVHSGNIGVIGLDAISSYVDVALTLPKLSDTI